MRFIGQNRRFESLISSFHLKGFSSLFHHWKPKARNEVTEPILTTILSRHRFFYPSHCSYYHQFVTNISIISTIVHSSLPLSSNLQLNFHHQLFTILTIIASATMVSCTQHYSYYHHHPHCYCLGHSPLQLNFHYSFYSRYRQFVTNIAIITILFISFHWLRSGPSPLPPNREQLPRVTYTQISIPVITAVLS